MPGGPINVDDQLVLPSKERVLTSMEELIHQFIIVTEGFDAPKREIYQAIEAPKGAGVLHRERGRASPYRMKIRSPSFVNLQALPRCVGWVISDVVAIIA